MTGSCPWKDSNLRFYLRRVALYDLRYGASVAPGRLNCRPLVLQP